MSTQVTVNRLGYTIDGRKYPRVTSIVGALPKPWMGAWAAKMVAEFAVEHRDQWTGLPKVDAVKLLKGAPWSKRDAAADRGSAVHRAMEAYLTGEPLPDGLTEEEFDIAVQAERWLKDWRPRVNGVEVVVFSEEHGYAGTLDLWADIDGRPWILDWKTSSGVYPEYAIQLAAYRHADHAVVDGEVVEWGSHRCERAGIVHIEPAAFAFYPLDCSPALFNVFLAAKAVKDWTGDNDGAVGDPIAAPATEAAA